MKRQVQIIKNDNINIHLNNIMTMILACLISAAGLMALHASLGGDAPSMIYAYICAVAGIAICVASYRLRKKSSLYILILLVPWLIPAVYAPVGSAVSGAAGWINSILYRWNYEHAGGINLIQADVSEQDIIAFTIAAAILIGELAWWIAAKGKLAAYIIMCIFWIWLMLIGGSFDAYACGILLACVLGVTAMENPPQKSAVLIIWAAGILGVVLTAAYFIPSESVKWIDNFRYSVKESIHEYRYGNEVLPEGNLMEASKLNDSDDEMLTVTAGQEKSLYLKGFVGGIYDSSINSWRELPDAAYSGEYHGIIEWLTDNGFNPLTQAAEYYRLSDDSKKPDKNKISINVTGAARDYVYVPDSLDKLSDKTMSADKDTKVSAKGFTGSRTYIYDEISDARPSELIVANQWVASPQTDEQSQYVEAETVYRDFVYNTYTSVDGNVYSLVQKALWEDYESDGDGIYSAVNHIRDVMKQYFRYTETPSDIPDGEEAISWYITQSREGNSMMYASIATEALRIYGIPARYVEGYYVSSDDIHNGAGKVSVTGRNAHAWVEVYFDGIGWQPVDFTPGYYYDTVTLQNMVTSPGTVHKTAALENQWSEAGQKRDEDGRKSDAPARDIVKKTVDAALLVLGIIAAIVMVMAFMIAVAQIVNIICIRIQRAKYLKGTEEQKAKYLKYLIYYVLGIHNIQAELGWNTKETDELAAQTFDDIKAGDYIRISKILEKSIYGGAELEVYEKRTLIGFLDKIYRVVKSDSWTARIKLRYIGIGSIINRK